MIVVVDYGMGNVGSVLNMLHKVGAEAIISSNIHDVNAATKLVLPGVGAFDHGMKRLHELNLVPVLNRRVLDDGIPVLGICLGVQLFSLRSEEGRLPGLGWIDADTVRFSFPPDSPQLNVPHMGWNEIVLQQPHSLFSDLRPDSRFYFVHSYHVMCRNRTDVVATSNYGLEFTAAVCSNNIIGTQFHLEKSHRFGLQVMKNFVEM